LLRKKLRLGLLMGRSCGAYVFCWSGEHGVGFSF
jgi:hypothetical protein